MNQLYSGVGGWWIGTALGGGAVLLISGILMRRAPTAAARQRLGEWGILAAILVAVLRMGPSWIAVPDPWTSPETPVELVTEAPIIANPQLVWHYQPSEILTDSPPIAAMPAQPLSLSTTPVEPVTSRWTIGLLDGLLAGYAILGTYFLARWLLGQWALRRILRKARSAPEQVQTVFDQLVAQSGQRQVYLLVSDRIHVPMCCGISRPTVVIPRALAVEIDERILRWVFAHELTHLARRDTWSMWFMGLAQSFYFYVPWFWWVRRQVRLCQEYIADAAAAAQGPWADDYAQFLVSLARSPAAPVGATGVLGNTSDLYRRVTMLLKPNANSAGACSPRQLFSGVSCMIASAIILAGLGVRAEPPAEKKKETNVDVQPFENNHEVVVIVSDDDDKSDKKIEKKDDIKRFKLHDAMQGVVTAARLDKAEIEKKVRKALEKAELEKEDVNKIVKEIMKALEQAHATVHAELMPKIAQFKLGESDDFKVFQGGDFKVMQPGHSAAWVMAPGGGGRLGIMIEKPSQALVEHLDLGKDQGIVIHQVIKGSSAEKAGLKTNDIILKFADKSVSSDPSQLIKMIDGMDGDQEITAIVLRKGKKETVEGIKLGEKKKLGALSREGKLKIEGLDGDTLRKYQILAEAHSKDAEKHAAAAEKLLAELHARSGDKNVEKSNRSVQVMVTDGDYSATDKEGDLTIVVKGKMDDGKVSVTSITISEGNDKNSYKSLDKVPSKYRARIEKLLAGSAESGGIKIKVRSDKDDD